MRQFRREPTSVLDRGRPRRAARAALLRERPTMPGPLVSPCSDCCRKSSLLSFHKKERTIFEFIVVLDGSVLCVVQLPLSRPFLERGSRRTRVEEVFRP